MNKTGILRFTVAAGVIMSAAGAGINLTQQQRASADVKDPPLRLVLNVPAHRLYVFENGENTRVYKVSVGLPGYQTPAGSYKVSQAIWNPWWHPPDSKWARGRKPEPPGVDNPMGRVKLNFAPLLYIHGTNDRGAQGSPASHGCVRLLNDDLIEFTRLVQKYGTPGLDAKVLARLEESPQETRQFNFKGSIPFEVVYNVADVKNNFLYVYPDVYSKIKPKEYAAQVRDVLSDNGIPLDEVDRERLDVLLEKGRDRRVSISLDELRTTTTTASTQSAGSK